MCNLGLCFGEIKLRFLWLSSTLAPPITLDNCRLERFRTVTTEIAAKFMLQAGSSPAT
jgi:hypothetical protein